ncbi:CASP 5C1 [Olea europaea subsp. europaea]|uniref:CASP-like protein n=1 Tax=Olea europaea subsp. europaea TaxID=158383 RepID=A0A8S0U7K6_OLEEU|nr:CASP 5C1 [Olea europaea subsp. europaea]
MDEFPGALGTRASLALRFGQAIFAGASLLFMCFDIQFYSYTAFCFLVTIMGLVIPWSLTLAVADAFSVFVKRPTLQPGLLSIIIIGDWVYCLFLKFVYDCCHPEISIMVEN